MDSDSPDIAAMQQAVREHDAVLMVDVAYDFGASGGEIDLTSNGMPMLLQGDHEESRQWEIDADYRTVLRQRIADAIAGSKRPLATPA